MYILVFLLIRKRDQRPHKNAQKCNNDDHFCEAANHASESKERLL